MTRKESGMKVSKRKLILQLVLGVLAVGFFITPGLSYAKEAEVVMIYKAKGDETEIRVTPPDLYIQKGTVVIWMNNISGEEVRVIFRDGKACQDVSRSPDQKGFSLDTKSCYVTTYLPYTATSSLQFMQAGTFAYSVSNSTGKVTGRGKIIVQDN